MRVGADIGGTFTDIVVFDEAEGAMALGKVLSTPSELARGVADGLNSIPVPLDKAGFLIHGSTVVVNAIIERKGARTALITTPGFRDVYEIGRINRPESFNPRFEKHRPLIPREHIFEVPERMLADGSERSPLDENAGRELAAHLAREGFDAVAIVFLHSYRAPAHELRMAQILRETEPRWFVSASHEISREYREYERTSTVAANAYVGPTVSRYLTDLDHRLRSEQFGGMLLVMQSNGGLSDLELARRQCIQMMESGPAGGVVGTMAATETLGIESAIAFDMGGTTAKACVVRRGQPDLAADYFLGGYNHGLAIRIPVLDIVEVGTGGGSIAWFDTGAGLHVGPRSAGAEPGPASYGRGGTEPTVTDANVVLGRLDPHRFLGGRMRLDPAAAERAIRGQVAEPLGIDVRRAAEGMLEIATSSMANAVRQVTLQRGLDPRDFTLVAYGGGGPLHAAAVARELAISSVVIPPAPGHFSALGMLLADLRRDFVQTLFLRLDSADIDAIEAQFRILEQQGRLELETSGIATDRVVFERAVDMRYVGQEHAVSLRVPPSLAGEESRAEVKRLFDEAHELRYGHSAPDEPAELVSIRVTAIGRLAKPSMPRIESGTADPPLAARLGSRAIAFGGEGDLTATVFERAALLAGNRIVGPAVIEEEASTTLVASDDRVIVDPFGFLVMEVSTTT